MSIHSDVARQSLAHGHIGGMIFVINETFGLGVNISRSYTIDGIVTGMKNVTINGLTCGSCIGISYIDIKKQLMIRICASSDTSAGLINRLGDFIAIDACGGKRGGSESKFQILNIIR